MLKRCQVLLQDWMVDDINYAANRYDLSFSELVRIAVCIVSARCISLRYPGPNFGVHCDELMGALKKAEKEGKAEEELHRLISKIYFEARKAIEFREKQEAKKKKKRP